jgi:hypothetical protein
VVVMFSHVGDEDDHGNDCEILIVVARMLVMIIK